MQFYFFNTAYNKPWMLLSTCTIINQHSYHLHHLSSVPVLGRVQTHTQTTIHVWSFSCVNSVNKKQDHLYLWKAYDKNTCMYVFCNSMIIIEWIIIKSENIRMVVLIRNLQTCDTFDTFFFVNRGLFVCLAEMWNRNFLHVNTKA